MRSSLPVISFDIDGTLNNYPKCFVDFVNQKVDLEYQSLDQVRSRSDYKELKHLYRISGCENIVMDEMVREIVNKLHCNFQIKIFTKRPFSDYPKMYNSTLRWLDKNDLLHDGVYPKTVENFKRSNVRIHVDDEFEHIQELLCFRETNFVLINDNKYLQNENLIQISKKSELGAVIFDLLKTC